MIDHRTMSGNAAAGTTAGACCAKTDADAPAMTITANVKTERLLTTQASSEETLNV
jgi:hypothetical protein